MIDLAKKYPLLMAECFQEMIEAADERYEQRSGFEILGNYPTLDSIEEGFSNCKLDVYDVEFLIYGLPDDSYDKDYYELIEELEGHHYQ